jgi:PII-like signaling protein
MTNISTLAPKIQTFFNQTANQVARAIGFVERASKVTGATFLQTLTFGFLDDPEASLSGLVETSQDLDVTITKQGLQTRITNAVPFLKEMFQRGLALFRNELPLNLKVLQQFTAVYITDSSTVALPESLQDEFPGCGGNGPDAAVKIQLTFEFLRGAITGVVFQAGRSPDQTYAGDRQAILAGALYLTDLGYFALARFRALGEQNAYFLSRFDTQTALFDAATSERFDLLPWLRTRPEPQFEQDVLIGSQARLRCRLVVVRVPQEVADQRRRRAYKTARAKGRTPSARHLELMNWSIFITNVPVTMLSIQQVVLLYSVRWQIELLFKLCKSMCALDRVAGLRRERVLSELYAKLIGVVVMQFLLAPYRDHEGELSAVKVVQLIQHHTSRLITSMGNLDQLIETLQNLVARFLKNGRKDKRQKRLTTYQRIHGMERTLA